MRLFSLGVALAVLFFGGSALAEDDGWGWSRRAPGVAPVQNALYKDECGSCHFAYQPGLLPARSWEKLMGHLDDHFGENAELSEKMLRELMDYVTANAADRHKGFKRSAKIVRSLEGKTPLRITDVPYIRYKHHEIPRDFIKNNPDIGSLSNCMNCHTRADTGSYSERDIRIPGVGRWEDD